MTGRKRIALWAFATLWALVSLWSLAGGGL
jgi:hypothetical protein